MSGLPKGWGKSTVAAVIEDYQPGFASGQKDVEGGVPHLRMNNIGIDGELVLDLVRTVPPTLPRPQHDLTPGDVLVCTTNSGKLVGKCSLFDLPGRYAFSNHLTRLRPNARAVDSSFLRWSLWQTWRSGEFEDKCKHWVNQSTLPKDALLETEFLLPPLHEQRRIVAKLETLLGKVDACQQRLAKIPVILKRFRQAVLAAACSGRLTADWREGNESAFIEISADRREFPDGWKTFAFGDLYSLIDGDRGPNYPKQHDYYPSGHCLFLSTKNVRPFGFSFDETVFISAKKHQELRNGTLKRGDVIITTRGTLGNVAVYDSNVPYDIVRINSGMIIIRSKRSDVVTQFLKIYIGSPLFSSQLSEKQTGSAQPQIPAGILKTFTVPVPSHAEQHEIVRRVESLFTLADQLEARYAKAKAHVDRLTQSILAKAFRGELVPQDENDEPVSVLLERIRAVGATRRVAQKPKATSGRGSASPLRQSTATNRAGLKPAPTIMPLVAETPASYGRNISQTILAHMQPGVDYTRAEITSATGITAADWTWAVRQLREEGKVVQMGERRGARYRKQS